MKTICNINRLYQELVLSNYGGETSVILRNGKFLSARLIKRDSKITLLISSRFDTQHKDRSNEYLNYFTLHFCIPITGNNASHKVDDWHHEIQLSIPIMEPIFV